jgi:hypothetical protein
MGKGGYGRPRTFIVCVSFALLLDAEAVGCGGTNPAGGFDGPDASANGDVSSGDAIDGETASSGGNLSNRASSGSGSSVGFASSSGVASSSGTRPASGDSGASNCGSCSVSQDCRAACGATSPGYVWCCANATCFQWANACPGVRSSSGSSSGSGVQPVRSGDGGGNRGVGGGDDGGGGGGTMM